ncbi:MAG: isocitrate lyase/phosphoenolpyruvate mutase family protein [Thermoanaerobaculia bacterium]|nr:isocitrate lyase/phosphoenolpyruvate mutase family protein [Thermoanaerobaculia bacterium]
MTTIRELAQRFRTLHEQDGAFVIPNPWDVGSARMLTGLGFEALATTSAGFAWTLGRLDGQVSRDEKLDHCRAICAAVDVPVSADLENGFGHEPDAVADLIRHAAETGLVGGSIEDYSGGADGYIYEFDLAVERIQAAVEAVRGLNTPFFLTARAENLLRGKTDLDDTIRRLQAFEQAGADSLYAPALRTLDEVRQVVSSVTRPLNVLGPMVENASVDELADAGAKRISVGGALARAALGGLFSAADDLQRGGFSWLRGAASGAEITRHLDPLH